MPDSFGARLRQQRERQQIALTSIARQTKISLSLLEGVERDDVSHWPPGIFRRSFIRAYAHAIGLEPDSVVREFLEFHPDPVEVTAWVSASSPSARDESVSRRPPTRLGCLVGSVMASLPRLRHVVQRRGSAIESVTATDHAPSRPAFQQEPNLSAAAHLCTELGRVLETREVAPLLEGTAKILGAVGIIVWVWDSQGNALRPALAHGYSDDVLAQLPRVRRDTDNATAAAFRSAQTRIVNGSDVTSGAVVVPLMTPGGCVGVFAVELTQGGEQKESVRSLATIFAAQLATLFGYAPLARAVSA